MKGKWHYQTIAKYTFEPRVYTTILSAQWLTIFPSQIECHIFFKKILKYLSLLTKKKYNFIQMGVNVWLSF